jgi:Flp pilus assembly protein TadG
MRPPLRRTFHQGLSDNSGAAAVEFAIISSVFLTLVFGLSYVAIWMFDRASLQWAVEHASRLAAINPSVTQNEITTAVNDYLTSVHLPSAAVAYSVSNASGFPVANIQASFAQSYTLPFVSTFNITYSASTYVPQGG